ncbi:DUF2834 domain-containing protein [Trichocoleus sp. FACHB-262]|uniref:DUF2834 domain-containing protein n=1 Tax=Trichocoleus sp. FACHB-262 TaxID=2692869 RepID=UPI001683AB9C|nr:DUF2834 domain-containing protein [Trichocoleus sp. FACHB-262]MBD2122829.1 DUF2834 domain-containing protein [Trichocoleus sp. FACHB-262]
MGRKLGLWLLWVGAIAYAFLLAPPNQPDTLTLIQKLSTGDWEGINPLIITLFNIMGVWPMIYSALLLIDGRTQKIPAWPFIAGSFGLGAFALLPYLALRHPNSDFSGSKTSLLKLLDSRWTGAVLALGTIALVGYGAIAGDWSDFVAQWQTNRFIHVMSLDFCLLCLLFPTVLRDDMARRGLQDARIFWAASLPLLGPALYLAFRPSLSSSAATEAKGLSQQPTVTGQS